MNESVQVQAIDVGVTQAHVVVADTSLQRGARLVVEILRDQSWFIGLALAYMVLGIAIGHAYGETIRLTLYSSLSWQFYFWFGFFFLIGRIAWKLAEQRPDRPLRVVWDDLRRNVFTPRRILAAIPPFFLLPAVFSVIMSIKRMIPIIHPFDWDPGIAKFDKWLHGGFYPWELLQPVLGYPLITAAISEAYSFTWYVLVLLMQFWYTVSADPRRQQFFITYLLSWIILGNGMAVAFASVGPCFYDHFVDGPNPFAAQMAYLAGVADSYRLISAMAQDYLWSAYQSDFLHLGNGISALPSMHLAKGTLILLWLWHRGKVLRTLSILYLVVLQLGSVHLAWHYAVDGYISIAAVLLIWWVVGRALNQRPRKNLTSIDQ